MEENKPKNIFTEKIIKIVFITALAIIILLLLIYFVLRLFNKNKVPIIPNETGAVQSFLPVSEKESYDELYNLMDKGGFNSDYFKIEPLYRDRMIQITVKKPLVENKIKAENWLKQNGYGNIPTRKIIYSEAAN